MIVIGSKALLHRLPQTDDVVNRYYKSDYDVIMTLDEFNKWQHENKTYLKNLYPTQNYKYKAIIIKDGRRKQYEIELAVNDNSSSLLINNTEKVCDHVIRGFLGEVFNTLNPKYQMLTKRSHLIYPVHFEKNMDDYLTLKNIVGEFERDGFMDQYYDIRFKEAKERFSKFKTPKLNVTNEDFFSSTLAVDNYYIHDDIHEVMKHHDQPVYEMMKRDFSMAACEKDMFFNLPYEYQIQCVQEEAYVIALERYIIPQAGEGWSDYLHCYKRAVKRICTTLCSGWFRSFAIENYQEVIDKYNPKFVSKFDSAVKEGLIKPLEGKIAPKMAV